MAPGITIRVVRIRGKVGAVGERPTSPAGLRARRRRLFWTRPSSLSWRNRSMQSLTRRRVRRTRSGFDDEVTMLARLSRRTGIPVAGTCASAVRALRLLDARRIALTCTRRGSMRSWNELAPCTSGASSRSSARHQPSSLPIRTGIEPAAVVETGRCHVPDRAEAVFIGGNGVPSGSRDRRA